eukprot:g19881.t1
MITFLVLQQLQQQVGPVTATPQLETVRVRDGEGRSSFGKVVGGGDGTPTSALSPAAPFSGSGEDQYGSRDVGGGDGTSTADLVPPALFSQAWEEQYGSRDMGCDLGRKRYYWRQCGLGSNILHLLNAFVYGLAVKNWSDVAIVSPPGQLGALKCTGEAGLHLTGYPCLFRPMPHVCNFGSGQQWTTFMQSKGVSQDEIAEARKVDWQYLRLRQRRFQAAALEAHAIDTFGALAVMARYLWGHLTPWLVEDVRAALERSDVQALRLEPYVGFHIRRGDKVAEGEADKVETKEYLSAALKHLDDRERQGSRHGAKDVKGIWVASDSQEAVSEVRALASDYFPNVVDEAIIWISGGGDGGSVTTHSKFEDYSGFVYVFADWEMLAAASVFVGTFSSNVSRVVALLREGLQGKSRDSCISLDREFGLQY